MTDVHFHPQSSLGTGVGVQQQMAPAHTGLGVNTAVGMNPTMDQTEMAAFEKGRMQGEMEAIRRMEAEQSQLKQFPNETIPTAQLARPDVVEINRLTWLQRGAFVLAELTSLAMLAMTIAWHEEYRGGYDWSHEDVGNVGMYNAHILCAVLGLMLLQNAYTLYRVLPLNLNPWINRGIYITLNLLAHALFAMSLAGNIMSTEDVVLWGADDWIFITAFFLIFTHAMYSFVRTLTEPVRAVHYETWAETNNRVTWEEPEQARDRSLQAAAPGMRTVYTPAPVSVLGGSHRPHSAASASSHIPAAPANAPRWAENPHTHAEDYFLLPRAKWAICSLLAMTTAICMFFAAREHALSAGTRRNWTNDPVQGAGLNQLSEHRDFINTAALFTLLSSLLFAYVGMPPRTTLVKNGILVDPAHADRRLSVSHNAETKIGHGHNIV